MSYVAGLRFNEQTQNIDIIEEDNLYHSTPERIYNPIKDLPSDFVTIDFETANRNICSPCSVGVVVVKSNQIVDSFEQLIKPHRKYSSFDEFNISIHGITPEMVKNAPEFDEIMEVLTPLIRDNVVAAHNMSFDSSVLYQTCKIYGYEVPACRTMCSMCISRLAYPKLMSHRLNIVCKYLGIDLDHHCACSDAAASAKIILDAKLNHRNEIIKSGYSFGYINNSGHWTPQISHKKVSEKNVSEDTVSLPDDWARKAATESVLKDKEVVFTGELKSMPRKTAFAVVEKAGGRASDTINKNTEFLVMGVQDYSLFADGQKSTKTKKAEALRAKGSPIEIISEEDFLNMIDWA